MPDHLEKPNSIKFFKQKIKIMLNFTLPNKRECDEV